MTPQSLPQTVSPASTQTQAPRPAGATERLTAAPEAIRAGLTPAPVGAWPGAPRASQAPRPTLATATRYPALAGCPDLSDHAQVVEAIGYAERARRLSRRQKWTRVERAAINAAVAYVQTDARQSLDRALAIWSEILVARAETMLSAAQDADVARAGSAVAA